MDKDQERLFEIAARRLNHATTVVGVELFRRKRLYGNAALKGLSISEFQAHALADLGNFFIYAQYKISPDEPMESVIKTMDEIGWFTEKGLGMLSMKDLLPLLNEIKTGETK